MSIRTAYTTCSEPQAAAAELKLQLAGFAPRFLVYFAAPSYAPAPLGKALKQAFDAEAIGCSTAGEFAAGKIWNNSLSLMAFDAEHIEKVAVAQVANAHSSDDVRTAYSELIAQVGSPAAEDHDRYIGLVLHDGMAIAEEKVMTTLSSLSNVPFVGGSAGHQGQDEKTYVYVGHEPSSGSAALALLKLRGKYGILKTQSFDVTDQALSVTRANEAERTVLEFNGKPAAQEYARALGVTVSEAPNSFMRHPLGLLVGDEPYVRSPQQLEGDGVRFYCNIKEGMDLRVLSARDIVAETKRDLTRAVQEFGPVAGLINFNCIQRTTELEQTGQAENYAALFAPYPSIGFSTFGESYVGHINQTSVILLFS